jgi:phosphatidylglycerophosphate synthase
MQLGTPFGAFLDPVADKVSFSLCCPPFSGLFTTKLRLSVLR